MNKIKRTYVFIYEINKHALPIAIAQRGKVIRSLIRFMLMLHCSKASHRKPDL